MLEFWSPLFFFAQALLASLQLLRAHRGQTPPAAEWRSMPQLRTEWWLCRHCKDAVNHQPQLGHNLQQMCVERQGDDAIICRALSTNAQRTAYGRRLKSVYVTSRETPLLGPGRQHTPAKCAGTRAAYRPGCCAADAGQRWPAPSLPSLRAFSLGRSGWRRWWSLVFAFLTVRSPSRLTGLSHFGRATMCGHSLRAARERLSSPSTFSRGEGVSTLALRGSH